MKEILTIDAGTIETGICIIEIDTYTPTLYKKYENERVLEIIEEFCLKKANNNETIYIAYEEFKSYGMPIGDSTIKSITWNGRFIQKAYDTLQNNHVFISNLKIYPILRVEEKVNICGTTKAKDSNIRQALIDRFGIVGTKNNKGFFYGFKADIWSAFAIGVTCIDKYIKREKCQ